MDPFGRCQCFIEGLVSFRIEIVGRVSEMTRILIDISGGDNIILGCHDCNFFHSFNILLVFRVADEVNSVVYVVIRGRVKEIHCTACDLRKLVRPAYIVSSPRAGGTPASFLTIELNA